MELSGSNIKKLLMLSQNKPFSYISRNENPEKIIYISVGTSEAHKNQKFFYIFLKSYK